ncbi:exodeoxyribonuclease VII large subunit [Povalibacter uvarum]|uniref:Exodeoxyribonuclease 7 large subunit n=1 Tax=Povalibacter uvarum TaxID=732238 RepID=A0A841HT64_9GAMM|nr:exodeoxyribonuclease VII large subunit [Povalibacter uvarum]MBB6096537.1 exodeoxyribonuclease VII large subunit [Povalibacter uvarum]
MSDLFANLQPERDVYTPTRLNREARIMLERGFSALWVEGEMSNLSRPSSGHWYFSIKDESAQLRCAMFRQRNMLARFSPKDGQRVLLRGRVSLYEPRGDYQFLVDHIEEAGEGELRRRFDLLKAKLAAEGLFGTERKRALPRLPRRIGIVTSPSGAAIRDILHILQRRFRTIPVLIYPVQVQGAAAAPQIVRAIQRASARAECDVLILARGGGSLEDLWPFNEEIVARAIAACPIPIVSGVGHEVDFTIADFVADVRAPTPSGAAELVAPDCNEWLRNVAALSRRLSITLQRSLTTQRNRLTWMQRRLAQLHPGVELRQRAQRLDELEVRLARVMKQQLRHRRALVAQHAAHLRHASPVVRIADAKTRMKIAKAAINAALRGRLQQLRRQLAVAGGKLDAISPLATLNRGYAIVTDAGGHVVTDASAVRPGDLIETRLAAGRLSARVERSLLPDEGTA